MKNTHLAIACALALAGAVLAADATGTKLTQDPAKVAIELGGKPFTAYWYADGNGSPFIRPFCSPLQAPDGVEVTADQIQTKGDHPHHRSLWVAHGDVNGADHWAYKGSKVAKQRHLGFEKIEGDTLIEKLEWDSVDGKAMLGETRTLRFFTFADGARGVDVTSVFSALVDKVVFGDTKEAGLCAVRVVKAISTSGTITNAEGLTTEQSAWGKKSAWCDFSGKIDGKEYGVAILDHPGNARHPTNWHVRQYGLMSANIFGLSEFKGKGAPKGEGAFTIEKGKPVTFRYRVVVHLGNVAAAGLPEKFKEFAGQ